MDIERSVQFILENQARVSAQMGELSTGMIQLQSLVGRIAQQQSDLVQQVDQFQRGVGDAVIAIAEEQKRLTGEQRRLTEEQRRLTEEQRRLAEAQRHTEERLNALITIADGLIPRRPTQ